MNKECTELAAINPVFDFLLKEFSELKHVERGFPIAVCGSEDIVFERKTVAFEYFQLSCEKHYAVRVDFTEPDNLTVIVSGSEQDNNDEEREFHLVFSVNNTNYKEIVSTVKTILTANYCIS